MTSYNASEPVKTGPATQTAHPWRATARTVFALLVGLASSWGVLVGAVGLDPTWQWVSVGGLIAAGVTRLLANPMVEAALQQYFPWLAALPEVE